MTEPDLTTTLHEQLEYYRSRATEYDQWWLRLGRYDRSPELNAQWAVEGAQVSAALTQFQPGGRILELACGTGIWTEQLLPWATTLTAVDGSPEMLVVIEAKLQSPKVRYVEADLFAWEPTEPFDTIFFGFWLSHVPPERFAPFWQMVRRCLAPGGRVFFVDSRHEPTSTAIDHRLPSTDTTVLRRRLNDGREYQIYKVFYEPNSLAARLRDLGWNFDLRETSTYFLYGDGGVMA
jgi:ubiquinone/menaquinone biosynthesis C-methylase UbiE